ncbi:MAG: TadE/TadG family type IV pilus assembly protein [Planctomycetaceae bacterium]
MKTSRNRLTRNGNLRQTTATRLTGRRGSLVMELVFVLPILGILLLGLFEYSLLFFARGEVVDACRSGARAATLPGSTVQDVEQRVLASLSPRLRATAEIDIQSGVYTGDEVAVSVAVPMASAAPDLLWPIGFGLTGKDLYSETHMVKE